MGLLGIINKISQFEEILDKVTPKVSFETFMNSVSETIDKIIMNEHEQGLTFLGGKTYFSISQDNEKIQMNVELFYANSEGGFLKKETQGTYPISMLNQEAQENFVARLITEGEFSVEVQEPRY